MDAYPNTITISPIEETLVQPTEPQKSFKIFGVSSEELELPWILDCVTRSTKDSTVKVVLCCNTKEPSATEQVGNDFERLKQNAQHVNISFLPRAVIFKLTSKPGSSVTVTPNNFELS